LRRCLLCSVTWDGGKAVSAIKTVEPTEEEVGKRVVAEKQRKREKRRADLKADVGEGVGIMNGVEKLVEVMGTAARSHHLACKCFRCRPPATGKHQGSGYDRLW
jgi:hypothetical protein